MVSAAMYLLFFYKILSLYILIALGWIAGRTIRVSSDTIATLIIYIISPVVFLGSISQLHFSPTLIFFFALPWLPSFASILAMRFIAERDPKLSEQDSRIVAAASGLSNGGYFGIPLYIIFFGETHLGVWMLLVVGSTLVEITLGYFQLSRANASIKESVRKVLKLPILWSAIAGLALSAMDVKLPQLFFDLHREFRGAYMVLGMMIIGISLSTIKIKEALSRAFFLALVGRLIVYPLCMSLLVLLESSQVGFFSDEMRTAALLFGFLPVAANLIPYCSQLRLSTEVAGSIVFISTVICTIVAPFLVGILN